MKYILGKALLILGGKEKPTHQEVVDFLINIGHTAILEEAKLVLDALDDVKLIESLREGKLDIIPPNSGVEETEEIEQSESQPKTEIERQIDSSEQQQPEAQNVEANQENPEGS
jgi:ribosomal protein L12E/L44/L45/RPP1/RPP2